jgi:hypothetical protein
MGKTLCCRAAPHVRTARCPGHDPPPPPYLSICYHRNDIPRRIWSRFPCEVQWGPVEVCKEAFCNWSIQFQDYKNWKKLFTVMILWVSLWYSMQRVNSPSIPKSEAIALRAPPKGSGMEYERSWEHQRRVSPEHDKILWLIVASLTLIVMAFICLTLYYHLMRGGRSVGIIRSRTQTTEFFS